jgi:Flp pilus assembly protein CpaB
LILALVGAGLVFSYGRNVDERIADGKETSPVLVALADLQLGTPTVELQVDQDYEIREIPNAYQTQGALSSLEDVEGLVLLGPVPTGSQLARVHFGSTATIAQVRPSEGNIALAVEVGISPGVARYIRVGSVVDLFVTYESGTEEESVAEKRTKLFLSGVTILAVSIAEPPEEETEDSRGTRGVGGGQRTTTQVIAVLDVTPANGERIVNSVTLGTIYLALSTADETHRTPSGVIPEDVIRSNR